MRNTKKLLLAIIITNLLCTFAAGHGVLQIGLLELLTLYSTFTLNFDEFPLLSFWTLAAAFTIIGQVITIIAIKKHDLMDQIRFGKIGTTLLLAPAIIIALLLPEQLWMISAISSMPFLVLTTIFWLTAKGSMSKLLMNGT